MGKLKLVSVSEAVVSTLFFCLARLGLHGAAIEQPKSTKSPGEVLLAVVDAAEDQQLRAEFVRQQRETLNIEADPKWPRPVAFSAANPFVALSFAGAALPESGPALDELLPYNGYYFRLLQSQGAGATGARWTMWCRAGGWADSLLLLGRRNMELVGSARS